MEINSRKLSESATRTRSSDANGQDYRRGKSVPALLRASHHSSKAPLRIPWPSRRRWHPAALVVSTKGGLCENQYLCVDAGIACVCRLRHRTDDSYNYDNCNASKAGGHAGRRRQMDAQQERRLAIDLGPSGMVALTTGSRLYTHLNSCHCGSPNSLQTQSAFFWLAAYGVEPAEAGVRSFTNFSFADAMIRVGQSIFFNAAVRFTPKRSATSIPVPILGGVFMPVVTRRSIVLSGCGLVIMAPIIPRK